MTSLPTRLVAVLSVLALLATACGTRDADLAARADGGAQDGGGGVVLDNGGPGTSGTDPFDSSGGGVDDGFGESATGTTAPSSSTVTSGASSSTGATGGSGSSTSTSGARPGGGSGSGASSGSAGSSGSGDSGSGASTSPSGATSGTTAGSPAADGGSGQPAGGQAAVAAGGCTPSQDTFKIGYIRTDAGSVGGLTGADVSAVSAEAQEVEWQALFSWARDTGGLCGAEIETVGETINAASTEEERLATCVRFTEDHQVDFMLDTTLLTLFPSVVQCFSDHGVPIIGGTTTLDRQFIAGDVAGTIASPGAALDRLMVAAALGPDQVGFYDGGTVGVILREDPIFQRVYDQQVAPALASLGVEVEFATIPRDGSTAPNVLLQMRSAGVDRILFLAAILEWLAFANAAEAQGYRPRYAFGEYGEMVGVTSFYGPHGQLRDAVAAAVSVTGAVAVPEGEEPERFDPSDPSTEYELRDLGPGAKRCLDVLSEYTDSNYYRPVENGNSTQELFICEHFFTFIDAARAVPGALSAATLGEGVAALPSIDSVRFHSSGFGPGIFDGARDYRVGLFHDEAQRYVAVTGWQELPR